MRAHQAARQDAAMPRKTKKDLDQQFAQAGAGKKEIAEPLPGGAVGPGGMLGPNGVADYAADPKSLQENDRKVIGNVATNHPAEPDEPIRVPRRFLVVADRKVVINGASVSFPRGKVLDDMNYDVKSLKLQGVLLFEVNPGEEPIDAMDRMDAKRAPR